MPANTLYPLFNRIYGICEPCLSGLAPGSFLLPIVDTDQVFGANQKMAPLTNFDNNHRDSIQFLAIRHVI